MPPLVRLPIRTLERLRVDAVRTASSAVFCPGQCRSLDLDTCRTCPRLSTLAADAIHCAPPVEPRAGGRRAAPVGSNACVGEAMGFAAVLVDAGVLAATFVQSTDMPGHSVAVVLDQGQRSLGLVDVAVAAAARQACRVGDLTRPVAPVREAASLAHAVDRMVHERARALPVLDEHDEVVGVLTDLDALRWVARRGHR